MTNRGDQHNDAYKLERAPAPPPDLPGVVRVAPDAEDVRDMLTSDLLVRALSSVGDSGSFHLALAPSGACERVLMKLMVDPKYRSFPWEATHVWSVREPCVHPQDPAHSAAALREILVEPSGMPEAHLHAIPAHLPDVCERASDEMIGHLRARGPGRDTLDAVLLACEPDLLADADDPAGRLYAHTPRGDPGVVLSSRVVLGSPLIAVLADTHAHWETAHAVHRGESPCVYTQRELQLRWYFHPIDDHTDAAEGAHP